MPSRDDAANMEIVDSIAAGNKSATEDGAAVDVTECDSATVTIAFGDAAADAGATYKVQEREDGGSWVDLAPVLKPALNSKLLGLPYGVPSANETTRYAYVGNAKDIRVVLGGTVADTDMHAQVIKTRLNRLPHQEGFTVANP